MNTAWLNHLQKLGGQITDTSRIVFASDAAAIQSAATGSILAILDQFAVIHVSGDDSAAFLQGQFTNDIRQITQTQAQAAAWCSPKGRVLTQLFIMLGSNGYFLLMPKALSETMLKRLRMFVMRSKVNIQELSDSFACLGFAGPKALSNLTQQYGALPTQAYQSVKVENGALMRLWGTTPRYLLIQQSDWLIANWNNLSADVTLTGQSAWDWFDIQEGFPWITAATSDEYVPQMLNLERLGAVSFTKGCYPGQEIVARTEYLGKVKRRLYKIHSNDTVMAENGQDIFTSVSGSPSVGKVINVTIAANNGSNLLAVVQQDAAESAELHLGQPTGPVLQVEPLPYSLDTENTPPAATP